MASTITWDILRQVLAEFTDEQLAAMRRGIAEYDEQQARIAACPYCDHGALDVTLASDSFRQFAPCPHCRTPNPPTSGEG